MATWDYLADKADADEMIAEAGMAAVLRVPGTPTGPSYDPTPGTPTDHDCIIVVLEFETHELETNRVLSSDKKILLAKGSLSIEPTPAHRLVIGGVEHAIIGPEGRGIKPLAPGGVTVLYELQCRR